MSDEETERRIRALEYEIRELRGGVGVGPGIVRMGGDVEVKGNLSAGSISGDINADTLDGLHASSFVQTTAYTAADVLAKVKTVDGAGSGLDADTVDGKQASDFLPAGASSVNTIAGGAGTFPQVFAAGSGAGAGAAGISFHRLSNYAVNFGIDTDQQLKIGGWSMGGSYKIWSDIQGSRPPGVVFYPTDAVTVTNGVQVLNGSQHLAAGDYGFNLAYFLPAAAGATAFYCRMYAVSSTPGSSNWVGAGRVYNQWSLIARPSQGGGNQWVDAHGIVKTGGTSPTFNVHVNGITMMYVFMLVFGYWL